MRKPLLGTLLSLFALTLPLLAHATVQDRITQTIASTSSVALPGTISVRAKQATDLGAVAPSKPLVGMSIRFNLTAAQQTALTQLISNQENPASPQYHQWLTPEQFGAQFGLSSSDLAKVSAWLTSQGFTVTSVARGGTFITFNGTAGQVEQAFGTSLHSLSLNGEQHFGNLTDPVIPAAFSSVVSGITGLNDFHLKPRSHARLTTLPKASANGISPHYTIGGYDYVVPADIYTIYNYSPLFTNGINGTGITIGIMGQTDLLTADLVAFRTAAGLSTTNLPTVKLVPTSSDPGVSSNDLPEAELDTEISGATAPDATILYVNSTDVIDTSLVYAIDNDVAPILSVSYGDCEADWNIGLTVGQYSLAQLQVFFQQANAQGQTIVAAAGDSGATDCEEDYSSSPTVASHGLAVDFPGSSPNVTSMGGTMFNEGSGSYWSNTNSSTFGSALGYIPEDVWNETYDDGETSTGAVTSGELAGGGGGASSYFTKPVWQTGTGVPNDFARDVPDISFDAASVHDPYLICVEGSCTNGLFYNPATNSAEEVGGTSVAAPSFAGVLALLEQKLGSKGLGNVNPTIYALANSTYATSVFHDVTVGNNAMPCTAGTADCTTNNPNYNSATGELGYTAGIGYDLATGWGSLNVSNLTTYWSQVTPTSLTGIGTDASSTTLTTSTSSISVGTAVTLTATVASATSSVSTTPTGSVEFLLDGTALGSTALSSGTATYALSATATANLGTGSHKLTASYSGDSLYAGSQASYTLNVSNPNQVGFTLSQSATSVSVAPGATAGGITFTVTPTQGFLGNVTFTASAPVSLSAYTHSFSVNPVIITSTSAKTTVLTLQAFVDNAQSGSTTIGKNDWKSYSRAAGSGLTFAALLLLVLPRRRRMSKLLQSGLLLALLSIGLVTASGCSSGGALAPGASGTTTNSPAGTYSILVTAAGTTTSGIAVTQTTTVTFIVQ